MLSNIVSRSALQAQKRAIAKTLCYRLFMILITITVAWLIVGDVGDAVNIGLATNILKTGTYYLYERLWDHITWGVSAPA
ncbi:DUF2061 domain-containing protein [Halostagnicola sp. A-GB9-2]|uniref:DUF2061 domain-containing protein n=1 Tax=Halostagnicola sp. A-GB9-2 TaxID=3048066 RepID=UPI0024BF534B|nr:DUF2061 domain-containing protein [Halostagnicola sp. A-GB9-2]MDJ1430809.1 DUF2061 domain-containing protein [Halostagnicola sp. A-GB9-2]